MLDPMNGSGQTTKVARNLGRRYMGLDIEPKYVDLARSRLRGNLQVSDNLIPVFHKESWRDGDQSGLFETEKADMSANIPAGYALEFRTESDKPIRGNTGVYAYYRDPADSYLCFIITEAGRQSRLNLGRLGDVDSMLHSALGGLPDGPFIKADLHPLLEKRLVENRQPVKACLDIFTHNKLVKELDPVNNKRRYELTGRGRRQRERWERK